jgi:uncharacterized protein (TIGR03435 family)
VGKENGQTRWVGNDVLLDWLAGLLRSLTGRPVINSTGLKGNYDFILTISSDTIGESGGPSPVPDDTALPRLAVTA